VDILSRPKPPARPEPKQEPQDQLSLPKPSPLVIGIPTARLHIPRKKSRKWLWFIAVPAVLIVFAIVGVIGTFAWYSDALQPRSSDATAVTLQVEDGATIDQVGKELEAEGVIKSGLAFSLYMKINDKAVIKTGTYLFAPNQSVSEIVSWLNDGRVGTRKVTILPGKTLKQIRQLLIDDGFKQADVDAALAKTYTTPLFADKPAEANLEGYIFPETYFVENNSTPEQLLERTFTEFNKRIDAGGLRAKLAARGFSLYQGITLASIVTREVTNPQDQHQVAQVLETRLQLGMMLGSDVTYHYAADLLGVEATSTVDSPYNTRLHTGLPPGPIANFNMTALEAVAEPSAGDYLYFVAGDDGATHYAHTFEEHQRNIQQYCKKLCVQS
jgi:UPF0755 protein